MELAVKKYEKIYLDFTDKFRKVFIRQVNFIYLRSVMLFLAAFLIAGLALLFTGMTSHLAADARKIFFIGYIIAFSCGIIFIHIKYLLAMKSSVNNFGVVRFSKKVGSAFPDVNDYISNSLSLYENIHKSRKLYSQDIIGSCLEDIDNKYGGKDFKSYVPYSKLKRISLYLIIAVFITALSFAAFPGRLLSSLNKFINYNYVYLPDGTGIKFDVAPGNTSAVKGSNIAVSVKLEATDEDFSLDKINLYVNGNPKQLNAVGRNQFSDVINDVQGDAEYYFGFSDIYSGKYKITIEDFPVVKNLKVKVTPPAYTRTAAFENRDGEGNVLCPEGSNIEMQIFSQKELSAAYIELNGVRIDLNVKENYASGNFTALKSGSYRIVLKDNQGALNKSNEEYQLTVIPDRAPTVIVIEPKDEDYTIKGLREILVRARISDDYGFSKLTLNFRKVSVNNAASDNSAPYIQTEIPVINKDASALEVPYLWELWLLGLNKGNYLEYYLEVTDNAGKTGRSDLRYLRVYTAAEFLKESLEKSKELEKDLKSVYETSKDLQKDIKDLQKNIQKSEETGINSSEEKRKELQQQVDALQNSIQSAQQKLQDISDELKQSNTLSDKTLEQYMKLQDMFNKINTPQFLEMLRKLQEALKKNDPKAMEQELRNMNFDEEAFRKQMEQIMELMQKIQNLQKMGELTQKLDDIRNEQQYLQDMTRHADKNIPETIAPLKDKQQELKNRLDDFKNELDELMKNMKDTKDEISTDQLNKIGKSLKDKGTQNKMQQSADKLNSGEKEQSEQLQDDIMKDLNELTDNMMDALDNAMNSDNMMQKMMSKMNDLKSRIEEMSKKQNELRDETMKSPEGDRQKTREIQDRQNNLKQELSQTTDALFDLTKEGLNISPELGKEMGNANKSMQGALNNLNKNDKPNATTDQLTAKTALDNAAKMLSNMIDQMSSKSRPGEKPGESGRMGQLMKKLAQMIKLQQGMNGQMQALSGSKGSKAGKEGKEGQEMTEKERKDMIDKLKIQQENIEKSLEELNAEFEKEKERTGEKLLGDLNEIKKDVQQQVKDLSEYKIDEETIKRQNRILSRMLDARLSQREKDFEQKRESNPGNDVVRTSPPEIIISGTTSFNSIREDFLRTENPTYTKQYEEMIERYKKAIFH